MTFTFSDKSLANLQGVHPKLVLVIRKALEFNIMDFKVSCGVRTQHEQDMLYEQGRSLPGPIVTWTKQSNHIVQPDGFGHAVDLDPAPIDFENLGRYKFLASLMFRSAMENGIMIRWLGHLPDPKDWGHYQII